MSDDEPLLDSTRGCGLMKQFDVVASCAVNWKYTLPDGTTRRSPLRSITIEVGYPDDSQPLLEDGSPNLKFHSSGFRVVETNEGRKASEELARWTLDNSRDVMRFTLRKLSQSVPGWDADEVLIRKTLAYDPGDPRVDLSGGGSSLVVEERTKNHSPAIGAGEVGGVYGTFLLTRQIPDAVSVELTIKIGDRVEKHHPMEEDRSRIVWDLVSNKYANETTFSYELHLTIEGPDFADDTIHWGTRVPATVDLPPGPLKDLGSVRLSLPNPRADQAAMINRYIKDFI